MSKRIALNFAIWSVVGIILGFSFVQFKTKSLSDIYKYCRGDGYNKDLCLKASDKINNDRLEFFITILLISLSSGLAGIFFEEFKSNKKI